MFKGVRFRLPGALVRFFLEVRVDNIDPKTPYLAVLANASVLQSFKIDQKSPIVRVVIAMMSALPMRVRSYVHIVAGVIFLAGGHRLVKG